MWVNAGKELLLVHSRRGGYFNGPIAKRLHTELFYLSIPHTSLFRLASSRRSFYPPKTSHTLTPGDEAAPHCGYGDC